MIALLIFLIILFIGLNAFFAGSETALTSLNKIRLRHLVESKNKRAILLSNFLKDKSSFLGTTLVGTNISLVVGSALATHLFSVLGLGESSPLVSTTVMTALILIFGEIIPKTVFRQSSNAISLRIIVPLRFFYKLLYPIIFVVTSITKGFLWPFRSRAKAELAKPFMSKTDIEEMLGASKKNDLISPDERTLIQRIFKMGVTTVGKIMIPLNEATLLNKTAGVGDLKALAMRAGFSRIPVYNEKTSNVVGVINVYDILFAVSEGAALHDYIQQPFFVNENERIDRVLHDLRKKENLMAIIINNDGNSVGLITIEDLLEELVGDIGG